MGKHCIELYMQNDSGRSMNYFARNNLKILNITIVFFRNYNLKTDHYDNAQRFY